jgi:hypothetical protein
MVALNKIPKAFALYLSTIQVLNDELVNSG